MLVIITLVNALPLILYCVFSGNAMPPSPTAVLLAKKARTQLTKAKEKEDSQAKKIDELTKEKDNLLAELSKCKYHIEKHLYYITCYYTRGLQVARK